METALKTTKSCIVSDHDDNNQYFDPTLFETIHMVFFFNVLPHFYHSIRINVFEHVFEVSENLHYFENQRLKLIGVRNPKRFSSNKILSHL